MGHPVVSRRAARFVGGTLAFLLLMGCAGPTSDVQRLQAQAAYERGLADLREGRAAMALAALREAAALDQSNARYHNTLGLLLLDMKRPEAMAEFQKAIAVDPQNAEAHHNLGVALAEAGRWEDAIAAYRKALAVPSFLSADVAHHNLAWALYNLNRDHEAEDSLRFSIRLNPTLPAAHYTLGLVLLRGARRDEARAAFRRAQEIAPDSPFGQAARLHLKALGDGG